MAAGLDREPGHLVVEIVGNGTEYGIVPLHRLEHGRMIGDVQGQPVEAGVV